MGQVSFSLNSQVSSAIGVLQGLAANIPNQFIVTPPGFPPGVSGYVFDVIDDEETFLDADITDSWLETNYAIQDHIALKPIKFTLRGFVGEVTSLLQIQPVTRSVLPPQLVALAETLPVWSTEAQQVYSALVNVVQQAESLVNNTLSIASIMNQLAPSNTAQQNAYNTFFGMWSRRILCTIQTPYGLLKDMSIESIKALQTGKTREISDFSVTFKQIQKVGTSVTTPNIGDPNPAGSATQSSPQDTLASLSNPTVNGSSSLGSNQASGLNTPLPDQTGNFTGDASGRISDSLAVAAVPGPNTTGSTTLAGSGVPVDVLNDVIGNSFLTGTATLNPVSPTPQISVPTLNSTGTVNAFQGYTPPANLPVPPFQPIPVSKMSLLPPGQGFIL